jgi:ribosomal protein S18
VVSSRISGNCARHQRKVAEMIKKARFLSLLPYVRY